MSVFRTFDDSKQINSTQLFQSRIGILMIGFTFAYGSMFAKVWIVHRMGASENQELASAQRAKEEVSRLFENPLGTTC